MFIIDHHYAAFRHLNIRSLLQHFDDLRLIVVARVDKAAHTTPAQAFLGDFAPALYALDHQAREEFINHRAIRLHSGQFIPGRAKGIRPTLTHLALKGDDLLFRLERGMLSLELCRIASSAHLAYDWHERFAGDIAAENQDIGLKKPGGIDELEKTALRAVYIGGEKDSCAMSHCLSRK